MIGVNKKIKDARLRLKSHIECLEYIGYRVEIIRYKDHPSMFSISTYLDDKEAGWYIYRHILEFDSMIKDKNLRLIISNYCIEMLIRKGMLDYAR